jgi:hypothetical protein
MERTGSYGGWANESYQKKQRVIAPGRAITRDGLLWGEEQTHLLPV